jgi:protein gp37
LTHIEWLIVGGESGPGFRPMPYDWPRELLAKARPAGTAFFFKQSAAIRTEMGTKLDGREIKEYPEGGVGSPIERAQAGLGGILIRSSS